MSLSALIGFVRTLSSSSATNYSYDIVGHFNPTGVFCVLFIPRSATLVFGLHLDMVKKRILTQDEIDRYMYNLDELSEDGLEYSDADVDFYLFVCHLMKIRIATVKIVLVHKIRFRM
ncbi:hypothetical protein TNCV_3334971 [Trichonephila clavipes]|nr:hypothetical protein TNCV_3334971 [Trichonephila clavipes]